jgi:Protein of unknown function (DUF2752)
MESNRLPGAAIVIPLKRRANLLMAGLLTSCGILYSFPPSEYHFYPICPVYALTHLLCPGCGGTRALYQLLHLNFSEAWRLNALVTIGAPLVLAWFFYWYYSVMRYDRAPVVKWPRTVVTGLYAAVLLFAIIRNTGLAFAI